MQRNRWLRTLQEKKWQLYFSYAVAVIYRLWPTFAWKYLLPCACKMSTKTCHSAQYDSLARRTKHLELCKVGTRCHLHWLPLTEQYHTSSQCTDYTKPGNETILATKAANGRSHISSVGRSMALFFFHIFSSPSLSAFRSMGASLNRHILVLSVRVFAYYIIP